MAHKQGHFEWEARFNLFGPAFFFGAALFVALLGVNCRHELQVDACLDAGRRWDDRAAICDFERSRPAP